MTGLVATIVRTGSCALVVAAFAPPAHAAAQELTPGRIIDRVTCRADATQSYALYLPPDYTPRRRWPVIFAFDAGARGRLPVERFKDAAASHGFIVAGSNDARHGPIEIVIRAVQAMLDDAGSRLAIDERRIYFAGFSAGARLAVSVAASNPGLAAGVIGFGAGFPPAIEPSPSIGFVYFGAAGTEDFNFSEMRQLDRALDPLGIPHRFATFQGPHDWAPPEICERAVAWLDLQAMRAGILTTDDSVVEASFRDAVREAEAADASGRTYEAYLGYERLVRDFDALSDVAACRRRADALRGTKAVKEALRAERDDEERQGRWMARLMGLKERYAKAENPVSALQDLAVAIDNLRRRAESPAESADRLVARRVAGQFFVHLVQQAANDLDSRAYARAAAGLSVALRVEPDRPRLFYDLACAYALAGRTRDAISALQQAVAKGFTDVAALGTDARLDALRREPAFQVILDGLRKKDPEPRLECATRRDRPALARRDPDAHLAGALGDQERHHPVDAHRRPEQREDPRAAEDDRGHLLLARGVGREVRHRPEIDDRELGVEPPDPRPDGVEERGRIPLGSDMHAGDVGVALSPWRPDVRRGLLVQLPVLGVGDETGHLSGRFARSEGHPLADRVLAVPVLPGDRLVHHDHRGGVGTVGGGEVAAGDERHAHETEAPR